MSIISAADAYKFSHYRQCPKDIKNISSYIESRGIKDPNTWVTTPEIVHFGTKAFLDNYLKKPINLLDIDEASLLAQQMGIPFNRRGWLDILKDYHGFLPLKIESLPEGTVVPLGTPQVQVVNTDDRFFWLTSYVETVLLRAVWFPSSVATYSREVKKLLKASLERTADHLDFLEYQLHDFGARAAQSRESAILGGMAHLINFKGTDTVDAVVGLNKHYSNLPIGLGVSIPAAEHSTITVWGSPKGQTFQLEIQPETKAFRNMINEFGGEGKMYSVVSDSYSYKNAVENIWCKELKDEVLKKGGTLVIRPDSGDPTEMVIWTLYTLDLYYGSTLNNKGFKVLHPAVRIIQGDGVNLKAIKRILDSIEGAGFSTENVAFGMGGALYNQIRDSFKYAMKANAGRNNEGWYDIYKQPDNDTEGKASKAGRQVVYRDDNKEIKSIKYNLTNNLNGLKNMLIPIYNNGFQEEDLYDFISIRQRAALI